MSDIYARSNGASLNADIGAEGELWFAAQLPRGWVWQPPRRDLGKDGLIVVRDDSCLHNLEFSVQVKSSVQTVINDGFVVKTGISRSSVCYWFASPLPTLVVAVDVTLRVGWFAWHLDLFQSPAEVFRVKSETLTIRIPEQNQINDSGWHLIRRHLKEHFSGLEAALNDAHFISRLSASLNVIATVVGNLVKLARLPVPTGPPESDEGISILIEQIEHQKLLVAVRAVSRHIDPSSEAHRNILFWLEFYESTVLTVYPMFKDLRRDGGYSTEFAFVSKLLNKTRPQLIDAGIDIVRLLTRRSPHEGTDNSKLGGELPTK